jgi:hypothetical protein
VLEDSGQVEEPETRSTIEADGSRFAPGALRRRRYICRQAVFAPRAVERQPLRQLSGADMTGEELGQRDPLSV